MISQKVTFQKSQKLLAEIIRERPPIQNIQYLFNRLRAGTCREASSFCDFWKMTSGDFTFKNFFIQMYTVLGKEYYS